MSTDPRVLCLERKTYQEEYACKEEKEIQQQQKAEFMSYSQPDSRKPRSHIMKSFVPLLFRSSYSKNTCSMGVYWAELPTDGTPVPIPSRIPAVVASSARSASFGWHDRRRPSARRKSPVHAQGMGRLHRQVLLTNFLDGGGCRSIVGSTQPLLASSR